MANNNESRRKPVRTLLLLLSIVIHRVIQSFEGIVDAVLNYDNDTNVDIVERNIAFKIRKVREI